MAAAKAVAAPAALNLDELFKQLHQLRKNREASKLTYVWFQTTRVMHCSTLEYDDAIAAIMIADERERRRDWHERRKQRCRERIAVLKAQRPLPLP